MSHPNIDLIDQFFEAYGKRDYDPLCLVLASNIKWSFPGTHPLSGIKNGVDEIVDFFDAMGAIMAKSGVEVEKLVVGVNDQYVIECQHIRTHRDDGHNLNSKICVLWKFENGKIIEGSHFFSDPQAMDAFFNMVTPL